MKILSLGAAGFIGSRIAQELLSEQCSVVALVRSTSDRRRLLHFGDRIRLVEGDFHNPRDVERVVQSATPLTPDANPLWGKKTPHRHQLLVLRI